MAGELQEIVNTPIDQRARKAAKKQQADKALIASH
jgi:hypothetical protein